MSSRIEEKKYFDVEKILDIIEKQFKFVMGEDPDYYEKYDIFLKNEQTYIDDYNRLSPNNIYMVVKFLPAEINYNQNIIPITITAISEHNKIDVCQRLLMEYAQYWNLKSDEDYQYLDDDRKISYTQVYESPSIMSNFNEVYYGYRSVFMLSGSILISYNTNPCDLFYYYNVGEEKKSFKVEKITFSCSFDASLDTQPFIQNKNFTSSVVKFGTFCFNVTTYLTSDELCNKILKLIFRKEEMNNNFSFGISFRNQEELNDGEPFKLEYKLQNASIVNNIGELPLVSLNFTN